MLSTRTVLDRNIHTIQQIVFPFRYKDYWARDASEYIDLFRADNFAQTPYATALIPDLLSQIKKRTTIDSSILDAGCGEGYTTRLLYKTRKNIRGYDISDQLIHEAVSQNPDITFFVHDMCDTRRTIGTFDIVVCTLVLNNIQNLHMAVRSLFTTTKKNGYLFVSLPHPHYYHKETRTWFVPKNKTPIHIYNYFKEQSFLRSLGTNVCSMYYYRTLETYMNMFLTAGFTLNAFREPKPVNPRTEWQKNAAKIPYYVLLIFKK